MIGDELIVVLPPGEDVGPDVNVIKLFLRHGRVN
jgi:hypothetical protein